MTTIATDGDTMAADGLVTDGDVIVGTKTRKLFRLDNGDILGVAGGFHDTVRMADWFNSGAEGDYVPDYDGTEGLLLTKSGHAFYIGAKGCRTPAELPAAIGSGMQFALAAMRCGATTAAAVGIAAEFNVYTGGDIFVEARATDTGD